MRIDVSVVLEEVRIFKYVANAAIKIMVCFSCVRI